MAAGRVSMKEPACLIETDSDGKLSVVRSSLEILEQIDQPVVAVAVVGLYRTGKSYLMNRLAGKHRGFALGAAVQSKTKGIWMWCVPHPRKAELTLVLLDTEGLGDVEKGDESNDNWIFAMAVLLSSTLVYNSMGTIDNNALEKLHYVTELTEHIKVKSDRASQDDDSEYIHFFPSFVWAVRDFTLVLELEGNPITANEYLENSLKILSGSSDRIQKFNAPRLCLRNYFTPRWCFVFERPANGQLMKRMEELTDADLEPAFVQQAREFTEHIYTTSETKTLKGGIKVTGRLLGNLAVTYVEAIRSGQIPCLDNAVLALAEIENSKAVERARALYVENMEMWVAYPTDTEEQLSGIHAQCESEALALFLKHAFKDDDHQYQKSLMELLQEAYDGICERNIEASREACRRIIQRVFDPLEDKLSAGRYSVPGGYRSFCEDVQTMTDRYCCADDRGVKALEVLSAYLEEKAKIGQTILKADTSLTEAEQRRQEEHARREEAERGVQVMEENLRAERRRTKDQQRTHSEHVRQLERKMESEGRQALAEYQRILRAKDAEMERYRQQGMAEKVSRMQREINKLKSEMTERENQAQKKKGGWFSWLGF